MWNLLWLGLYVKLNITSCKPEALWSCKIYLSILTIILIALSCKINLSILTTILIALTSYMYKNTVILQ
jgi:hypothetical protein